MAKFTTGRGKLWTKARFSIQPSCNAICLGIPWEAASPSRCDCLLCGAVAASGRGLWTCTHGTEACQQQPAAAAAPLITGGELMRGLVKATHYYSTQQARADWAQLAQYAKANGYGAAAVELEPPTDAGHKTIDKRINSLMARMGITEPFWKWQEAQEAA